MSGERAAPGDDTLIYTSDDGRIRLDVRVHGRAAWLAASQMASLFEVSQPEVEGPLFSLYDAGTFDPAATIRKLRSTRDGRLADHYDLDVVAAVGDRLRSPRGKALRQWAASRLRERLAGSPAAPGASAGRILEADPPAADDRYFDDLLARLRAIRASERRDFQRLADIYATSVDYDPGSAESQEFFSAVQNRLHYAVHGRTAAGLIRDRADASRANMGLTTWKAAPSGPVRKSDVGVARNYLTPEELTSLERLVGLALDLAEDQARRHHPMHMADWLRRLDALLAFTGRDVWPGANTAADRLEHDEAEAHARRQYAAFAASHKAATPPAARAARPKHPGGKEPAG